MTYDKIYDATIGYLTGQFRRVSLHACVALWVAVELADEWSWRRAARVAASGLAFFTVGVALAAVRYRADFRRRRRA